MGININMNKLRLKWKIFIFLLGFCALLLVILWLFQTVFLNEMYKFTRKQELANVITTVEKEINNPQLYEMLPRFLSENDVIVSPTRDFIPPQNSESGAQSRREPSYMETITEIREFTLQNGHTISLTFYAPIAPVNATVNTLRYQLYLISGIMMLLAAALAIIIAKRVSKPIEDINTSAASLAEGHYDTRFSGKGFYEIVALSDTLNTAAIELGRVESLRRELMANVSHDLRTPLALIYSYTEMMNDFPAEITAEQTQVIMDETQRLTTLVNDVLDLSKLEGEMEKLSPLRYNLTKSILETTQRTQELLKKESFDISFIHYSDVYINADEAKIDRAFYNLLINAVNYSGDSREVVVNQTVSGSRVRISVTDNGEGISEADLPFIWDRYYKSGKAHKRAITGTGLGLSIVKKIVELHGGDYGVVSEPGCGSTFWFELDIDN